MQQELNQTNPSNYIQMPQPTCNICTHSASQPYSRMIDGKYTEHCISTFHNHIYVKPSNEWTFVSQAQKEFKAKFGKLV